MESEQFFLKWNNFESNLASGFADLLQREAMVDVTLAAEGKIVQAHKIILSICSSYFRNMFQVNPCQHPIVILKDVRYQELADMLDFMYKGEANVRQEDLPSFLKLAETLKVKGLAGNQVELSENSRKWNLETQISNLTKDPSSHVREEPSNDFLVRDTMIRKKAKRCHSPVTFAEAKDLPQSPDIKLEIERCDNNFMRNIVDNSCQNIILKEERLSDSSLDSYGENHMPENSEVEKNAGPSTVDENFESVPQGEFCSSSLRQTRDYCFMESCFGGHLLIFKGYIYRRKSVISGRSYWNCCSPKCFAKGILLISGEFQLTNSKHNHKPDFENLKRKEKLIELKRLALQVDVPGLDLLKALQIKDDVKKHLALVRTWRRREKKKTQHLLSAKTPCNVGVNYKLLPSRIPSKEILFHLGYYFRQDSVNPLNEKCKYWRCKVKKCKARAKTDHMGNLTILQAQHNHIPEEFDEMPIQSEQMIKEQAPSNCEQVGELMNEQYNIKGDTLEKSFGKETREAEVMKQEKLKTGMESAPITEETNSAFCSSENFSFDKLMLETLEENYCITHEFNESLNLLKSGQIQAEGV